MTDPPANATVLNTTALSNFAQVDHVELLLTLPRLVTVDAVRAEIDAGTDTHPYLDRALAVLEREVPVVTPSGSAATLETQLRKTLDPGEAEALAVAEATDGLLVTDDGDARTTATERGVALTGSIGLLVRFVDSDDITAATADDYLKRWIDDAGFRSPARDFAVFLDNAGDN
ncbi:MAG: putative nucleic acid-binding protein, contains PIN domain protein [uncultured archaeon A07HN63]|nr:MAG: putative nucleic acid-binding protein, contains PIN domain protein [uncultured archaeon A07HN63]